jgi:uncharacterized OB-fold protein/putative sterol carrier protein
MILEGDITIPYKWTTGQTVGRFLTELRDNARLVGAKCAVCGKVYVPPPDVCGECFERPTDWVELSGEGFLIATSVVHRQLPWSPLPAPYTLALIKLDGADTNFIHMARTGLKTGDRVRAKFKEQREGTILDIENFSPVSEMAQVEKLGDPGFTPIRSGEAAAEYNAGEDKGFDSDKNMESTTDIGKIFRLLPTRFRSGKISKTVVYYFSIDDEKWTVTVGPDRCEVVEGQATREADCFLKTSKEIMLKTFRGEYTPTMMDFMTGKIKTNRPDLMLTFREVFGD